jgi:hypothetical protein
MGLARTLSHSRPTVGLGFSFSWSGEARRISLAAGRQVAGWQDADAADHADDGRFRHGRDRGRKRFSGWVGESGRFDKRPRSIRRAPGRGSAFTKASAGKLAGATGERERRGAPPVPRAHSHEPRTMSLNPPPSVFSPPPSALRHLRQPGPDSWAFVEFVSPPVRTTRRGPDSPCSRGGRGCRRWKSRARPGARRGGRGPRDRDC